MSIKDSDLVRVRSFSELRPGMTVVVKNCIEAHGRTVSMVLLSQRGSRCRHTGKPGFAAMPDYSDGKRGWCFCGALMEGTLYRLRDLDKADELRREQAADTDEPETARDVIRRRGLALKAKARRNRETSQ